MDEKVVFQEEGNLVSNSRIVIAGQTFATRNVGSVQVKAPGVSTLGVVLAGLGLILCLQLYFLVGLPLAAVGAIWVWTTSRRRELRVVAGGGEIVALASTNGRAVQRLHDAIAQAIATR